MLREHGSDLQGALFYAKKAVKLEPDWANTHNTLANALLALEVYHEAKVIVGGAGDNVYKCLILYGMELRPYGMGYGTCTLLIVR